MALNRLLNHWGLSVFHFYNSLHWAWSLAKAGPWYGRSANKCPEINTLLFSELIVMAPEYNELNNVAGLFSGFLGDFAGLGFIPRALSVLGNYPPPRTVFLASAFTLGCSFPFIVTSSMQILWALHHNQSLQLPILIPSSIQAYTWTCKPKHNRNLRIKNHLVHPQTGSQFLVLLL